MMVMTSLQRKIIIVIIKSNVSMIIFTTLMMIEVKAINCEGASSRLPRSEGMGLCCLWVRWRPCPGIGRVIIHCHFHTEMGLIRNI